MNARLQVGSPYPRRYLIELALCSLTLVFYILWFAFNNVIYLGWLGSFFLLMSLFSVLPSVRLASFFTLFLISYIGMNLITYLGVMASDSLSETQFNYLFITGASVSIFVLSYRLVFNRSRARYAEYDDLIHLISLSSRLKGARYKLVYVPIVASILLLYIDVYKAGGVATLTRAMTKEGFGIYAELGKYFIIFSLPSLFVLGVKSSSSRGVVSALNTILVLVFAAAIFYALRTRSYIVGPVISYAGGFVFYSLAARKDQIKYGVNKLGIKPRHLVFILISALIIVSASTYLRFYRGIMEAGEGSVDLSAVYERSTEGGDLGYGYTIIDIMETMDYNGARLNGQSYYRLLFTPIPRSIWPNKPRNTQQIIGNTMGGKVEYYSLPAGAQGDAYINFGILGVLVFAFYGVIAASLDKIKKPYLIFFALASFMPLFHLARGGFTNPVVLMIAAFLSAYLFYGFVLNRKNR
ncbi:hypothetical protein [Pseudomonas sp. FME51]|uniref:hypothetical protein n=1 Tax=Pseudomonas sp. FME51 TaxID=2742609 RepID=UPI001865ECAE|nr:hypothetical protein [Pseudomonas sp. FME51]